MTFEVKIVQEGHYFYFIEITIIFQTIECESAMKQSSIIDMSKYGITFQVMYYIDIRDRSGLSYVKLAKKNAVHSSKYILMSYQEFIASDETNISEIAKRSSAYMTTVSCKEEIKADNKWHLFNKFNYTVLPGIAQRYVMKLEFKINPVQMSFKAIHDDIEFTDFELRGTDGSVYMHKAVAAAISPYFKKLFTGILSDTSVAVIEVPNSSLVTLQYLKDYMYTGEMPNDGDLKELLLLSSMYMMQDLEMRCLEEMIMQVNAESAYDLIEFAMKHNISHLSFKILELVQNGYLKVEEMKKFYHEKALANVNQERRITHVCKGNKI